MSAKASAVEETVRGESPSNDTPRSFRPTVLAFRASVDTANASPESAGRAAHQASSTLAPSRTLPGKRLFDIVFALGALVVFAPLMVLIFVLVRRDGGDGIFTQNRIGANGRMFRCFKFRTMVPDAENVLVRLLDENPLISQEWIRERKLRSDPRVTPIGAFLRRKSLDELPQLWNVLKGDMSIVGPRPIIAAEQQNYGADFDAYLAVKPGLTGLWQVSGRNNLSYPDRVALDVRYAENMSWPQDLGIVSKTIGVVLSGRGAC